MISTLSLYDRNIRIGKIYELVKQLNSEYNNFIINKIDTYKKILDKYIDFNIYIMMIIHLQTKNIFKKFIQFRLNEDINIYYIH